jgi:hypothetical protein
MAAIEISCREQKNTFWRVILLTHSAKRSASQISLLNPNLKRNLIALPCPLATLVRALGFNGHL